MKTTVKMLFRLVIMAVVAYGIARAFANARTEFHANELSWTDIRYDWIVLSGFAYAAGLFAMGWYWFLVLRSLDQPVGFSSAIRAYFVGHLGKYVPGKALVVVMRTGLVCGPDVNVAVTGIAVFIETLTMMSVGAFLAAVVLCAQYRHIPALTWTAVAVMMATIVPTLPPILVRIVGRLKPQHQDRLRQLTDNYSFRLMLTGWIVNVVAWSFLAVSLWASVKAWSIASDLGSLWNLFPLFLASVASAVVLGFGSLIPGGLFVREWIMSELMAPQIGVLAAVAGTILVRFVWLMTELAISGILYFVVWSPSSDEPVAQSEDLL